MIESVVLTIFASKLIDSMYRLFFSLILILGAFSPVFGQSFNVTGKVVNSKNNKPVELVVVSLGNSQLWSVSDAKGYFNLKNVPAGKTILVTQSLGYISTEVELDIAKDISNLIIEIKEDNLSLDEVVVTAQRRTEDLTTSYILDRNTLNHAQILNLSDISSLLPGGKTQKNINLASEDNRFALRSEKSEKGNSSFGTAIEVDGVRLDNNSIFESKTQGVSTRGISSVNIESIEVISGIASVEYGDLSNGIVKVNTRKGKTPYNIEFSTKPHTKQFALSKGFLLAKNSGALNASLEHTKSNSDIASPYTTYERNAISLNYSNVFYQNYMPVGLTVGIAGNMGGSNSKDDPDLFNNVYEKQKDDAFRANFKLDWLLNKQWITNLELSGSLNFSDRVIKKNTNKNTAAEQPYIHGTEEGHFLSESYDKNPYAPIIVSPVGNWYELMYNDNKPIIYTIKLKADWARKFGNVTNKILLGSEFKSSGNRGRGVYYADPRLTPTWREYQYKDLPYMKNTAIYLEDRLSLPIKEQSKLEIVAGIRTDITSINKSEYGTVSSVSPRFNAKYIFWENSKNVIRSLNAYAGWGKAVKLPSFEVLYPRPTYTDIPIFGVSSESEEKTYGYYIMPIESVYNSDLKWQHSEQFELGLEANILGAKISLSAFYNKIVNPYIRARHFTPFTYTRTDITNNTQISIPDADRLYTMDRETGIVTVSDKNNLHPSIQLASQSMNALKSSSIYTNGSDVKRSGVEWIVDFPQIKALRTSIRLDGNYYYYKGVDENLIAATSNTTMEGGKPYKYIGYYAGSSTTSTEVDAPVGVSNGQINKLVNSNLTLTTHIPKIRLIISLRVEGSFYNYNRRLSEYQDGRIRGFVLQNNDETDISNSHIYGGNRLVAIYPEYYSTWEEPNVKVPFAEKFIWAKENDPQLYKELYPLVVKSTSTSTFNPSRISSYFTANLSVTKELGNLASVSFYANNFLNTMRQIKSSSENTNVSLYNHHMIPKFYYGLSLRLKL